MATFSQKLNVVLAQLLTEDGKFKLVGTIGDLAAAISPIHDALLERDNRSLTQMLPAATDMAEQLRDYCYRGLNYKWSPWEEPGTTWRRDTDQVVLVARVGKQLARLAAVSLTELTNTLFNYANTEGTPEQLQEQLRDFAIILHSFASLGERNLESVRHYGSQIPFQWDRKLRYPRRFRRQS